MTTKNDTQTSEETKQLPLRLPADDYRALKAFAFFTEQSMNQVMTLALREFLAGPGRREQLDAMLTRARSDYRVTLDKLKDL